MSELPPDLARLGDALTAAARRAGAARQRRSAMRRWLGAAVLAAVVVGALLGVQLRRAGGLEAPVRLAAAAAVAPLQGTCDQPRGARFSVPERCSVTLLSSPGRLR